MTNFEPIRRTRPRVKGADKKRSAASKRATIARKREMARKYG